MRQAIDGFNLATGAELTVTPVENQFLGPEINVSGLLSGQDLVDGLRDSDDDGPIFVTRKMISDRTGTLLDDQIIEDVAGQLGRPIIPCDTMSDVARYLRTHRPVLARVA